MKVREHPTRKFYGRYDGWAEKMTFGSRKEHVGRWILFSGNYPLPRHGADLSSFIPLRNGRLAYIAGPGVVISFCSSWSKQTPKKPLGSHPLYLLLHNNVLLRYLALLCAKLCEHNIHSAIFALHQLSDDNAGLFLIIWRDEKDHLTNLSALEA
jgi:hypothetical protein